MPKQTTRDAALSRLFGGAAEKPQEALEEAGASEAGVAEEGQQAELGEEPRSPSPKNPASHTEVEQGGGGAAVVEDADTQPRPASGYIGLGRYTRADGVVERITPYVRPDQAEALRLAVARKNDPRGTDVSQIIQALLDEAGYRG